MRSLERYLGLLLASFVVLASYAAFVPTHSYADTPTIPSDFNLQVTPSPLVTTVKPGTKTQVELKVHNGGTGTEQLKIEPRSFTLSNDSKNVKLEDNTPPDIGNWVSFSQPKFTLLPGQWITEEVIFTVPKAAGFSYSFALVISRQSNPVPANGTRAINGSLAIFTLINVNRPGATSNLAINNFTVSKKVYEYLPATFSVQFKNNGNTIAQPYGNIFVQRSTSSKTPLASLTVNETKGYILPGTTRTITATWSDGFPIYKTITNADGSTSKKLVWNWGDLSKLRVGRYTANLVAVYNQAGRDVPLQSTLTFWVIPWKILLGLFIVTLLILFSIWTIARKIIKLISRMTHRGDKKTSKDTAEKPTNIADHK